MSDIFLIHDVSRETIATTYESQLAPDSGISLGDHLRRVPNPRTLRCTTDEDSTLPFRYSVGRRQTRRASQSFVPSGCGSPSRSLFPLSTYLAADDPSSRASHRILAFVVAEVPLSPVGVLTRTGHVSVRAWSIVVVTDQCFGHSSTSQSGSISSMSPS